tara:strand:- start:3396 stop:5390 length:1995 start_codon:yes stop_codon:yes gene_type:complete
MANETKLLGNQIRLNAGEFDVTSSGKIKLLDRGIEWEGDPTTAGGDYKLANFSTTGRVLGASGAISVNIDQSGSGYSAGTVTVSNDGGTPYAATYEVDGAGAITKIVETNFGAGYGRSGEPVVTISDPGGLGSNAVLSVRYHVGETQLQPGLGIAELQYLSPGTYSFVESFGTDAADGSSGTMSQALQMSTDNNKHTNANDQINNLGDGLGNSDLASWKSASGNDWLARKDYVDEIVSSSTMLWKKSCHLITDADYAVSYSAGTMAMPTSTSKFDSQGIAVSDRVLFAAMTTRADLNGIWECTQAYSAANMVLHLQLDTNMIDHNDVVDSMNGLKLTLTDTAGVAKVYSFINNPALNNGDLDGSDVIVEISAAAGGGMTKDTAMEKCMEQLRFAVENQQNGHGFAFQIRPEAGVAEYAYEDDRDSGLASLAFSADYSGTNQHSGGSPSGNPLTDVKTWAGGSLPAWSAGTGIEFERPEDSDAIADIIGSSCAVTKGDFYADTFWHCATDSITALDTAGAANAISWVQRSGISQTTLVDTGLQFDTALSVSLADDEVKSVKFKARRLEHDITANDMATAASGVIELLEAEHGFGSLDNSLLYTTDPADHKVFLNGILLEHAAAIGDVGTDGDFFIENDSGNIKVSLDEDLVVQGDFFEMRFLAAS